VRARVSIGLGILAVLAATVAWGLTGERLARWRAERTARAFGRAVWQQDSVAIAALTRSGSATNVLCAARGPLAIHWRGSTTPPRVVRRVRYHDTLQFTVQPSDATEAFVFALALGMPLRVQSYRVPDLGDSASALAFWACVGVRW
jgi:hypothetical protein